MLGVLCTIASSTETMAGEVRGHGARDAQRVGTLDSSGLDEERFTEAGDSIPIARASSDDLILTLEQA